MFNGCTDRHKKYKWISMDNKITWDSSKTVTCEDKGYRTPTKTDFLTKLEEDSNFFEKDVLYKVNPTIKEKFFDNKNIDSGQALNNNNQNIYFDINSKQIINYAVAISKNNNIKIITYCIQEYDEK